MDQAARRPTQLEARRFAARRVAASRVQIVRGLHGECGFRRWHARTDGGGRTRADCVHVFGRIVVAMPSANHLGQSGSSRLDRRAHHADREIVAARARAVRARRGRANHLRRELIQHRFRVLAPNFSLGAGVTPAAGAGRVAPHLIRSYAAARWFSAWRRKPAVYDAFTPATSSGVPLATTWPPRSPPSGPRSIR
jgi:hypothetical protein